MQGFRIPNNDVASDENQSLWMSTDIDALVQGLAGEGVLRGCAVTEQGVPNMTVAVAAGTVRIGGAQVSVAGGNVALSSSDAVLKRIDLIVVDNAGTKSAVMGTPGLNPFAQAIPADSVLLAMVFIGAALGAVTTAQITDKRVVLALPVVQGICQGRLTTESGVPFSSTDRIAQSTIYLTQVRGNQVSLFDGVGWIVRTFNQPSLVLSALTSGKLYDVFAYDNTGTVTLALGAAWTDDVTRSAALALQDGVEVLGSDHTRLYIGTIRTTSTTTTESSLAKRFVWNAYNDVDLTMRCAQDTGGEFYGSAMPHQANGNAADQLEYVVGLSRAPVRARVQASGRDGGAAAVGVGVDSTSVNSAFAYGAFSSSIWLPLMADYEGMPGIGYHVLVWLQWSAGGIAGQFLANYGPYGDGLQGSMYGSVRG